MSETSLHTPEHLARYLDRVRSSYPYGIPTASIRSSAAGGESLSRAPLVSFILVEASGALPSEHSALVDSIASKGLKVALEHTTRRVVTSEVEIQTAIQEETRHGGVVIVLGAEQSDGQVRESSGASVLYSHPLAEIASNPAVKRAFWGHLRSVIERIG